MLNSKWKGHYLQSLSLSGHVHESRPIGVVEIFSREHDVAEAPGPSLINLNWYITVLILGWVDKVALGKVCPCLLVVGALQIELVGPTRRRNENI